MNLDYVKLSVKNKALGSLLDKEYLSSKDIKKLVSKYIKEKRPEVKQILRDKILFNHIRLIIKLAFKKIRKDIDIDDLFMSGIVGFYEGLDRYKINEKYKFSTYITFWIVNGMYKFLYSNNIVFIPRGEFNKYNIDRRPMMEIAYNYNIHRLDQSVLESDEDFKLRVNGKDFVDTRSKSPEKEAIIAADFEIIKNVIDKYLTEKEKGIIIDRYLLDVPLTLDEISKKYGCTKEAIRMAQKRALNKIKKFVKVRNVQKIAKNLFKNN